MSPPITEECKVFVERLKNFELADAEYNPGAIVKFYPLQNPDNDATIFDEVYSLIDRRVQNKVYKFKLFFFINVLLSSTKVPAYVVAAYIKRLSRLTLNAKPRTLVTILHIVGNLMIRHPMLWSMRDKVIELARKYDTTECTLQQWIDQDPFDCDESKDLKKTKAIDSSIWELMPLRYHKHAKVAAAAAYLNQQALPDMEFDIYELCSCSNINSSQID